MPSSTEPLLTMQDVYKRFGGVRALQGASLEVAAGEVHGLLGPNGSGKSTLNKVLSGTVNPDKAQIVVGGKKVSIGRPLDAHQLHIASVYQQLSLVPELSVANNLLLGTEITRGLFVSRKQSNEYVQQALEKFWPGLDAGMTLQTDVADLSPGTRQLLEIAKAVARKPQILVLDEATASLRSDQVELVFQLVRELVTDGVSVIFVSHRLEEVKDLCDRATILRNGHTVATANMNEVSQSDLVSLMVGELPSIEQEIHEELQEQQRSNTVQLKVENLHSQILNGVSLQANQGEIIGLGGLQGQGQSELLHVLFGDRPKKSGTVTIGGQQPSLRSPRAGIAAGLALVPGDRAKQGLFMQRPILENLSIVSLKKRTLPGGIISMKKEKSAASKEVDQLSIKIGQLMDAASTLSGGNQQKIVLGKWLLNDPQIILLDDPTKGVDIGAKAEIYAIIRHLTAQGITVVLNSSDDEELVTLCDRVFVLYEGKVVKTLQGPQVTKDNLVSAALLVDLPSARKDAANE